MPVSPEPGASAPVSITAAEAEGPVREIKLLPSHKRALALKEEERNPYAKRMAEVAIEETESGEETESDKIRRLLTGIPVTGRTYGKRGIRLLAGDIIFETGKEVPKVLEDQTERLVVENLTENTLTLGWIDPETGEPTGKRLNIAYDMETVVAYKLAGQTAKCDDPEGKELKFGSMRRDSRPAGMAEDPDSAPASDTTAERSPEDELKEFLKQGQ